ncbi:CDP-alcohol phosphatidyltransferase family protein [Cryptosporangium sp. NPDC051539]|uniref:CDP-alcohol phosphatidyltransferase family protein n=1 Tax=Cryptosporangium sp. NPDC051539 TaxID=3363962 RepID=UPI00378C6C32
MPETSDVAAEPAVSEPAVTARVLTVPNALSALRLLGVPVFIYLVLVLHADLLALLVLVVSGFSDWLDGALARAWGQVSRIGQLLDPLADRLYVFTTVLTFAIRDIIPWWLALALIVRDGVLWIALLVLRRYGYEALPVHYVGKAATFNLLYAFPLLLLGGQDGIVGTVSMPIGWAFAIWGVGLYWWAAVLYVFQTGQLVRLARRDPAEAAG